jgi:hypothetical protein
MGAQKVSVLLAFRKPISARFFRTPGRDIALAIMDSATATVAALPAEGLYALSPAASVSRIVAWLAFDSGKVRGASNIGGLSEHRVRPRTNPGGSAESGRGIRRGILGVAVR